MKSIASILLLSTLGYVLAWDNTPPPIPDRLSGSGFEQGTRNYNIDIELIYDLGCDKCKAEHPIFQTFLQQSFLDGKVIDAVTVRYSFSPLPFHFGAWFTTKLLLYMEDLCRDNKSTENCSRFLEYITLAFNEQDWILKSTAQSFKDLNALVQKWTQIVADKMNLDVNDLRTVYSYDTDTHNSEQRAIYLWKYTASRAVGGTESVFVNGIRLQNIPGTTALWLQLITDVYNSQTKVPSMGQDIEPIEMVIRRFEKFLQ